MRFALHSEGVFAPTLFSKTFGNLVCESCSSTPANGTIPFTCKDCHYETVGSFSPAFGRTSSRFLQEYFYAFFFFFTYLNETWATLSYFHNRLQLTHI